MILAYIPFVYADAAVKLGWHIVGPLPFPHGAYSMLGEWLCDCPFRMWRRS